MKERNIFDFPDTLIVQNLIKSPKRYEIEDLVKVILYNIYGIEKCKILIANNDFLLKKFEKDDLTFNAILDKTSIPHTYNLFISSNANVSLEDIICHEMVHLHQYERGDLEYVNNGKPTFKWKGKISYPLPEYWKRPWEIEARDKSTKLWKEFKKLYYAKQTKNKV